MKTLILLSLIFVIPDSSARKYYVAEVHEVIDGDTVVLLQRAWGTDFVQKVKCRLSGIDAPELDQPHGKKAKEVLKLWVSETNPEKPHVLVIPQEKKDKYGRLVAELVAEDKDGTTYSINENMLFMGYAHCWDKCNNLHRPQQGRLMEKWARSHRLGLWKDETIIKPWTWRKRK